MPANHAVRLSLLAFGALLMTGGAALAVPLDDASCAKLRDERGQLEQTGLREMMARGAAWAAVNLPAAKLREIQRLIELDEHIAFRCPLPVAAAAATGDQAVPLPKRKPRAENVAPPPKKKPSRPAN